MTEKKKTKTTKKSTAKTANKKSKAVNPTAKTAVDGITSKEIEALTGTTAGVSGPGEIVAECAEQSEGHGDPTSTAPPPAPKKELSNADKAVLAQLEEIDRHYANNPSDAVFNRYVCRACGKEIITKDVDPGVTPFMIPCDNNCSGDALSAFYHTGQERKKWDYEWYRPEDILRYLKKNPIERDHILNGGLVRRKVEE